MNHLILWLALAACCMACTERKDCLQVSVTNPATIQREGELVEVDLRQVYSLLAKSDSTGVTVLDEKGEPLPSQITYDSLLIFPVTIDAQSLQTYTICKGQSEPAKTITCGQVFEKYMSDLTWENDKVAFRAYGPGVQQSGQQSFGYDLFAKRGTELPFVKKLYDMDKDPKSWDKYYELCKTDSAAAQEFLKSFSYHVDHGYGMDCYAVGPTLGAGTAALIDDGEIVYPWCYDTCEVLDNGPLRFTARLTFTPLTVQGDTSVIETRIISLDAGSHFNRTEVSYKGLESPSKIAAGIVLHDKKGRIILDKNQGLMGYEDPTTGPDQGKLFMGCVFENGVEKMDTLYFPEADRKAHGDAYGHLLATTNYQPESKFVYYWGYGWDKSDMKDWSLWEQQLARYLQQKKQPLEVKICH